MELERIAAGIRYPRIHEAEHLHDLKNKSRPRTVGKNAVVTAQQYLPLLQASLNMNVVNTTSRTILTHIFSNDNDEAIPEASYTFPLYDGSTVVSFACWIGGVTIVSSVETKTKAHEEYQAAVSRNDVAILLGEHTSEIFETSLGNIPARTDVRIEITYVNELKPDIEGEGVLVTIPTSVAPRYGTPPEDYTRKGKSSLKAYNGMEICIEVSTPVPIRKLECRTHPISIELGSAAHSVRTNAFGDLAAGTARVGENRRARATLSNSTPVLGRDFVLLILVHGTGLLDPRAVMESCPRHPRSSAIQVAFKPQDLFFSQLQQDSFKAEVIFVADRSASMGSKICSLRRSLGIFLQSIPKDGFHFNIASFGSHCSLLWPQSKPYDQKNLAAAHQHLGTFDANMGGTEIQNALQKVVESRLTKTDLPTEILILTDGEVWDVDATIDFVHSTREKLGERIRFFTLGIGNTVSHKLVEGIGRYGGGFADVLAVNSPGSWDTRVVRMLKGALSPSSWTCQITPKVEQGKLLAVGTTNRSFIKAPYKIPPLLNTTQAISYLLIDDSNTQYDSVIVYGASSSGKNATVEIPIERVEVSEPTILHLAAKATLTDMDAGKSQLHDEAAQNLKLSTSATDAYIRKKGEELGKKWSITGKWTSFVGTSSSNPEKHFTRIYQTNRAELAELTEFRGGYHRGDDDTHVVNSGGDEDDDEKEEDDDGYRSMADSDDSDTDMGGYGYGGDDAGDPKRDSDGAGGGSGRGYRGNERDGAGGDGDGNGRDGTQRYPHGGNNGGSHRSRGNRGRGGNTDGINQVDDHSTENFETGFGRQAGVGDGSKGPFWTKWLSMRSDKVTTVTDDKVDSMLLDEGEIEQQRRQWFQSGSGISREVFMVEAAHHFGPGTTVRTGSNEGVEGYWVTAKRGPNIELVQNLKLQTEKWKEEIKNKGTTVSYLLSSTYKSQQPDGSRNTAALQPESPSGNLPPNLQPSAPDTPRPEFRSIVNCYEHSGSFSDCQEATMIFNQLLDSFKLGTDSVIRSKLQADPDHQLRQISDKIYKTAMSTIYIKKSYPSFDGVWELIIRKAEAWVDSVAHVPIVRQELEHICSANWIGTEIHNDESFKVEEDQFGEASRFRSITPSQPYHSDPSESFPGYDSSLDFGGLHRLPHSPHVPYPALSVDRDLHLQSRSRFPRPSRPLRRPYYGIPAPSTNPGPYPSYPAPSTIPEPYSSFPAPSMDSGYYSSYPAPSTDPEPYSSYPAPSANTGPNSSYYGSTSSYPAPSTDLELNSSYSGPSSSYPAPSANTGLNLSYYGSTSSYPAPSTNPGPNSSYHGSTSSYPAPPTDPAPSTDPGPYSSYPAQQSDPFVAQQGNNEAF